MQAVLYKDMERFWRDTSPLLLRHEMQNNLILSNAESAGKPGVDSTSWTAAAVWDGGQPVLCGLCTPPFNIVLYEEDNRPNQQATELLAQALSTADRQIPGVTAEQGLARRFALAYCADSRRIALRSSLNLMECAAPAAFPDIAGEMVGANQGDLHFLPYWEQAFSEDCHIGRRSVEDCYQEIRTRLEQNPESHFLWWDGLPVAQAVHGRSTPNGAVISNVYTPPYRRGRGYAAALVAALTLRLLDRGNRWCALTTNCDNTASNRVYYKVGYRTICVRQEYAFEALGAQMG